MFFMTLKQYDECLHESKKKNLPSCHHITGRNLSPILNKWWIALLWTQNTSGQYLVSGLDIVVCWKQKVETKSKPNNSIRQRTSTNTSIQATNFILGVVGEKWFSVQIRASSGGNVAAQNEWVPSLLCLLILRFMYFLYWELFFTPWTI